MRPGTADDQRRDAQAAQPLVQRRAREGAVTAAFADAPVFRRRPQLLYWLSAPCIGLERTDPGGISSRGHIFVVSSQVVPGVEHGDLARPCRLEELDVVLNVSLDCRVLGGGFCRRIFAARL